MNNFDELKQIEEETKLEIITLKDRTSNEKEKRFIHNVGEQLDHYFKVVYAFVEKQKDNENIAAIVSKVKNETKNIVDKTKDKLETVKEDEKLQEFLIATGNRIDSLVDAINENEVFCKVKSGVKTTISSVKNDPKIKKGVSTIKSTALKAAHKALVKVEEKLSNEKDDEIVIHEQRDQE